MQVFKFGGASIKDAKAVRNIAQIISQFSGEKLVVIVSAMGKSTNKLEEILTEFLNEGAYETPLQELKSYHIHILEELFENASPIKEEVNSLIADIEKKLISNKTKDYNYQYDAIISFGERISSLIIAHYLKQQSFSIELLNAAEVIRTDDQFKEGLVNWIDTEGLIQKVVSAKHQSVDILLTQGFIGSSPEGEFTTLGREGSDFTAAIFASCLQAKSVTIWKDVPGILNADPKKIENASLYDELSYQEAAEMTYYGASVIHPKTIKPLANKKIPLYVKSFQAPQDAGTIIHDCHIAHLAPCIIMKENQCLITFKVTDFTFISEYSLSKIFTELSNHRIKINMMQNSAISFSICVNYEAYKLKPFLTKMREEFEVLYNSQLTLITVKNYQETVINQLKAERKLYLEQRTRKNYQMVVN